MSNLWKIVSCPSSDFYVYAGKPKKIKNLAENIGKKIVIDGKTCILMYPLQYLVNKGQDYIGGFIYSLEVAKNGFLQQQKWEYRDGYIRQVIRATQRVNGEECRSSSKN